MAFLIVVLSFWNARSMASRAAGSWAHRAVQVGMVSMSGTQRSAISSMTSSARGNGFGIVRHGYDQPGSLRGHDPLGLQQVVV